MHPLITTLACLAALTLHAQGPIETVKNDSGTFVMHRFTTGELSTKEWTDAANRWGRSWAYDREGHMIYQQQTRQFAGHASVDFSYHPNGAVSRAAYSTMPDGGIQWYRSTTTFDEDGKQTGFSEEGWDNDGPLAPGVVQPAKPVFEPGMVYEQRMFTNEYFVVNAYRRPVRVELRPKQTSPAAKDMNATLLKGDTLRGGTYSMGELRVDPLSQVAVNVRPAKGRKKLGVMRVDSLDRSAEHRQYFLIVGKVR
ncbi:MAG TPA: hypothetical protein PKD45_05885 [Flavobacteriales bacterium]|nr:hypothetical protein [Flavobacteriales bacterium]